MGNGPSNTALCPPTRGAQEREIRSGKALQGYIEMISIFLKKYLLARSFTVVSASRRQHVASSHQIRNDFYV